MDREPDLRSGAIRRMKIALPPMGADAAASETDAVWLVRSGFEPETFEHVVDRHHARVFRYVLSRLGPDAAEDVVSETFVTAFAARGRFDPKRADSALPWLLGIATRLIARQRDMQARWFARCAAAARTSSPDGATSDDAIDRIVDRADAATLAGPLAAALATLSRREREPLLLHVLGGLSYEEVAAALDVPVGTVRSRISRASGRLAGILDGVPR